MKGAVPILLAGSLIGGCGGRPGAGPSSPSLPQIAGRYSGPTTDNSIMPPQQVPTWSLRFLRPGGPGFVFRNCSGSFTIQQSGSTFAGSFRQDAGCATGGGAVEGQVSDGVVGADGKVTFSLRGPASDTLAWTGFAQCTPVTTGTTGFAGTIATAGNIGVLDASLVRDALIDCPGQGTLTINVRIRGAR